MSAQSIPTNHFIDLINPHAAGADIGDQEIWIALPHDRCQEPVRRFPTYTVNLHKAVKWLLSHHITTIAMEATGIYWVTFHDLLEEAGIEVYVVNSRHVKNVTGRKTDILDCQWIQQLHSCGLLNGSFHPTMDVRSIRTLARHRQTLTQDRVRYLQRMQKALQLMNIKLNSVLSTIGTVTGMTIIRNIVAGVHDPADLALYRKTKCHHSHEDFVKALTGHYREEHIFTLQQALSIFDFLGQQIDLCDQELEKHYQLFAKVPAHDNPKAAPVRRRPYQVNLDIQTYLFEIYGVDLTAITGFGLQIIHTIFSEIGTDIDKWPTANHFASWLGLCPNPQVSGGKILKTSTNKNKNRVAIALRMAAQATCHSQCHLGHFYRRMRAKHGAAKAITATAHKMCRIVYFMLSRQTAYSPPDPHAIALAQAQRKHNQLAKQAKLLGYDLTPQVA